MAIKCTLNRPVFEAAVKAAGDARSNGTPNFARISRRTGIDRTAVSRIVRGETRPDLGTAMAFARAYSTTVEQLITAVDESPELQATA